MSLANERITIQPLEESLTNMPYELNGVARGMGTQIIQQGSTWTPAATETPQVAQSADTEGGLVVATTIGFRSSPIIKFGIVEPLDPAGTNWVLNPQCVSTGSSFTQVKGTGAAPNTLIRDLIGYDYAMLQVNPGSNTGEGLIAPVGVAPGPSGSITAGVWMKGVNGGEAVQLSLNATGAAVTSNVTLTTTWQWYTITQGSWSVASPTFQVVGQGSVALAFYATGWSLVPGATLLNGFDGITPGCSWIGLPHSSQSTRPAAGGARMTAIMGDLEQQIKLLSQYGGTIRRMLPTAASSTFRITYDVVNAQLSWDDMEYALTGVSQGTITFTCQPYGRGPEMTTVTDSFNPLIKSTYVVDAGAFTNFTWGATGLSASANLATENRFLNQASEYPLHSGEVQATFTPGATISGFKGGVIFERGDASNYIEAYVSDNGASSFLKVDKVVAGSRTNELSATLGARIVNGTAYTVRGRVQRQNNVDNVYAEYYAATSVPATTGIPTNTVGPYVITDAIFGAETPGLGGLVFIPETAGAKATSLIISPYLARERTLPVLRFGLAGVPGTVPGLGRMDITDGSGNNQNLAIWGERHDRLSATAATTDLFYEAEALTPVNGATIVSGFAGASGGDVVQMATLPANAWVSFLSTQISSGSLQLTHTGSYRVWARCYSSTGTPSFQFVWGVGSLSVPTTNPAATLPGLGAPYLLNLGTIQINAPPQGPMQWFGVVQAQSSTGTDTASVDMLFFQPLNDGGAVMSYVPVAPSSVIQSTLPGSVSANDAGTGTIPWGNLSNVFALDNAFATSVLGSGNTSEYLKITAYGFAVPAAATITGLQANMYWTRAGGASVVRTAGVHLVKAGAVQAGSAATSTAGTYGTETLTTFGGPNDLWGASWLYSDINNAGFGFAVAFNDFHSTGNITVEVDYVSLTVYYTLSSGFTIAQDAVIYAGQTAEVGSSYAWRVNAAGTVWGPVGSYMGQYMKVPTATAYDGFTNVLVKASENNLGNAPDTAIDDIQVQVSITPRYAQVPDS